MPVSNLSHSRDFTGENFYIGLDVHKKSWSVTVRTSNLEVGHFSQAPDPKALHSYLTKKFPSGTYYSAYEAGFSGTSSHTALCKFGIQNIIVHAGDIPNTDKEKKSKTDVHDSRTIAKYLEKGLLKPIHVLTDQQQELRGYFRLRESQVRDQYVEYYNMGSVLPKPPFEPTFSSKHSPFILTTYLPNPVSHCISPRSSSHLGNSPVCSSL